MKTLKLILNLLLFCFILALMVSACRSPKFQVERVFNKYPELSEKTCVSRYPVNPEYVTVQEYIPGDTIFIPGVTIDCDSVLKSTKGIVDTVYIKKLTHYPCPPTKFVHDTIKISEKITIEDTRKLDTMALAFKKSQDRISQLSSRLETVKTTRNRYFLAFLALLSVIGVAVYTKLKSK